ncbi:MAG: hypothetical protein PHD10_04845 [Bacilli bacterium]|nr:hypothetical protein [Bacilli bacterium]
MKKLLCLILIGILCLSGCTNNSVSIGKKSKYIVSDNLVSLKVKEGTLTKSIATLILENYTDDDYLFGKPYAIEKEVNGIWYELNPIKELVFNLPAYSLKAKERIELEIDWEYGYGILSPGKYRIIKGVFPNLDIPIEEDDIIYIAAEFMIK